jgi:5'-3' exonuclease
MGVERFFSSVYKEFNIIKNIQKPYPKYKCKYLLIDFNSIIHTITSTHLKDLKDIKNIFIEIEKYINNLVSIINCEKLYIAIDGVPSLAKMLEQKKRRYLGEIINNIIESKGIESNHFDKMLISPATKFMEELSEYLKNIKIDGVEITISDYNQEGEGEMKIIRYIKNNNIEDAFVYSPDSDMILLLSLLELNRLILFRHDQKNSHVDKFGNYEFVYNYLDVNLFKKTLSNYIKSKKINNFDKQRIINDIVYIFTLFGNDFLPKIESLKVELDLFILIDYYLITYISDYNYIINNINDNKKELNYYKLYQLLENLSNIEYLFIYRNKLDYLYVNYERNFSNKFIYDVINGRKIDLNMYHYQLLKYVDWSKILKNPLDYLKLDTKTLFSYLISYIKKENTDIFLGQHSHKSFSIELKIRNQSIKDKFHEEKTKSYSKKNKIVYQIDYKLDEYSKIFNSIDPFYENINYLNYQSYDSLYNSIYHITPNSIQKYMEGWQWILEYYFNQTNTNLFAYFYHKAPLIKDIVAYFKNFKKPTFRYFEIKPIELLLYITPFKNDKKYIENRLYNLFESKTKVDEYTNLILDNKNIIFLDKDIKDIKLDCTGSIFTSKCHYIPLNRELNIIDFISSISIKPPKVLSPKLPMVSRKASRNSRVSTKSSRSPRKASRASRKASRASRKSTRASRKSTRASRKASRASRKASRASRKTSRASRKSTRTSRKASRASRASRKASRESKK